MCKLAFLTNINGNNRSNAMKFIVEMSELMSSMDKDGFGYAATNNLGEIFGERWLNNRDAFVERNALSEIDKNLIKQYKGFLGKERKYDSFGEVDLENVTSITLHARMATSGKEFFNTHPFLINGTTLVHNGVIRNTEELDIIHSTCDSEGILNKYNEYDVTNKPVNIQKVAHALDGYYACGIFSVQKDGKTILDVFKDQGASLTGFVIEELGGVVFATSGYHVIDACRKLGFNIQSIFDVASGMLLRINAITGDVILTQKFNANYKGKKHKNKWNNKTQSVVDIGDAYKDCEYTKKDLMAAGYARAEDGEWHRVSE